MVLLKTLSNSLSRVVNEPKSSKESASSGGKGE